MRPISLVQSFLKCPLNELLGTPANVRLLRLLAIEISEPIAAPDAAVYTGITEAGARRALKRLAETGFVERIGSGRTQQFCLRQDNAIASRIRALFQAEQDRYHTILAQLKESLSAFPEIRVAWIDDLPIEPGQPLHIGLLADSRSLAHLADELRRRMLEVEREYDLLVEIHTFSPADIPAVDWNTAPLLAGIPLVSDAAPVRYKSHAQLDSRSRRISKAIAEMLDRDPALLKRTQRYVESRSREEHGASSHDIREWKDILSSYTRETLKSFLVSDTPRAQRLRQSSPFLAALSAKQRDELRKVAEQHDS